MARSLVRSLLVTLLAVVAAGRAPAQSAASAAWQVTPASVLKSALRATATAQEHYRAGHETYAPSVEPLGLAAERGVRIAVLSASATGWQAKATHESQPGRSCVIFVGTLGGREAPRTDGDGEMAGEEGVPLCDRMR